MAQATPNGMENKAVIKVNNTVPITGVKIPPLVIPSDGTFVTKSHDNWLAPLDTISQITTTRKKHTNKVLVNKVPHSMILDNLSVLRCMIFSESVNKIFA